MTAADKPPLSESRSNAILQFVGATFVGLVAAVFMFLWMVFEGMHHGGHEAFGLWYVGCGFLIVAAAAFVKSAATAHTVVGRPAFSRTMSGLSYVVAGISAAFAVWGVVMALTYPSS